jgi:hypothetical protein
MRSIGAAYALFRNGSSSSLNAALSSLGDLTRLYPTSSAAKGDAGSLKIRICDALARRGDEQCAAEIVATAKAGPTVNSSSSSSSQGGSQARSCPSEDDDNDERIMALNALMNMNSEACRPDPPARAGAQGWLQRVAEEGRLSHLAEAQP